MGKGGNFEREVSKTLTRWLSGTEKPYLFWRMPGSGGLATIHEENRGLSGDIRALHPDAEFLTDRFSIECKTGYPRASFWQHFKAVKHNILKDFWEQAVRDAYKAEKTPMLIYRKKGKQRIVGICEADRVGLYNLLDPLPSLTLRFELAEFPQVTFYDFDQFLEAVSPEDLR